MEISVEELEKLHHNWTAVINYPITQELGDKWIRKGESAVLKVPSAIIDLEYNYLINPEHPAFSKIRISRIFKFTFDPRLKANP